MVFRFMAESAGEDAADGSLDLEDVGEVGDVDLPEDSVEARLFEANFLFGKSVEEWEDGKL